MPTLSLHGYKTCFRWGYFRSFSDKICKNGLRAKIRLTQYLGRYDKCDPLSQLRVRIREKWAFSRLIRRYRTKFFNKPLSKEFQRHWWVTFPSFWFFNFFSETLKGDHKYYCETCCSKQEANKSLEVRTFPKILALHLKRFRFDDGARSTNMTKLCYRYVRSLLTHYDVIISENSK